MKYKLTDITKQYKHKKLFRIQALKDFGTVKKGDYGGFVESEDNLSQFGLCWVYSNGLLTDHSMVTGDACIYNDAHISDYAKVQDQARIYNQVCISDHAVIQDKACLSHQVQIKNRACVSGNASIQDAVVIQNNAIVTDYACIYDQALIEKSARICDAARVGGTITVTDYAVVKGDALIEGSALIKDDALLEGHITITDQAYIHKQSHLSNVVQLKQNIDCHTAKTLTILQTQYNPYRQYETKNNKMLRSFYMIVPSIIITTVLNNGIKPILQPQSSLRNKPKQPCIPLYNTISDVIYQLKNQYKPHMQQETGWIVLEIQIEKNDKSLIYNPAYYESYLYRNIKPMDIACYQNANTFIQQHQTTKPDKTIQIWFDKNKPKFIEFFGVNMQCVFWPTVNNAWILDISNNHFTTKQIKQAYHQYLNWLHHIYDKPSNLYVQIS